jgi:DNA replication protein DnaC
MPDWVKEDGDAAKAAPSLLEQFARERCLGIPPALHLSSLEDFVPEDFDGAAHFTDPESLLLYGLPGRGKTHLAAALARAWRARWCDVAWLICEVRSSFGARADRSELEILRDYAEAPVLVLDDILSVAPTDYAMATIQALLTRRISYERPTIVTLNVSGDQVEGLSPSIASRLASFRRIHLVGEDRRRRRCRS